MADIQLGFFGEATPLSDLGTREVRKGSRGGSTQAATVPDQPEKYVNILRVVSRFPQADFEIAAQLPGVHPGTVSKRRLRLERAGLIEEVQEVRHRTPHGVEAMVFRITNQGKEVLRQWRLEHQAGSSGRTPPSERSAPTNPSSTSYGLPPASGPCSSGGSDTPAG
jgi:hypothetical protein